MTFGIIYFGFNVFMILLQYVSFRLINLQFPSATQKMMWIITGLQMLIAVVILVVDMNTNVFESINQTINDTISGSGV